MSANAVRGEVEFVREAVLSRVGVGRANWQVHDVAQDR